MLNILSTALEESGLEFNARDCRGFRQSTLVPATQTLHTDSVPW